MAERCTGASRSCPGDAFFVGSITCPAVSGVCDVAELCSGTAAACPGDGVAASTTLCRSSAATCDVAESCSGTGKSCPTDAKQPSGAACTSDANVCTTDQCDGSGTCAHANNSLPCDDGNAATVSDQCSGGLCNGTFLPICGETDGVCPDDCSIESDADCSVCVTRSLAMVGCDWKVTRRRSPDGTDRMSMKCEIDACDAEGGISPSTEGIGIALADASGACFRDDLVAGECLQISTGYKCSQSVSREAGIRVLKLKARSACEYSLRVKLADSDLACLHADESPWVPTLVVGDDCGDVGCPMLGSDKTSCPGTCGDDATDAGEQCDGADDASCPGLCDTTCTCR